MAPTNLARLFVLQPLPSAPYLVGGPGLLFHLVRLDEMPNDLAASETNQVQVLRLPTSTGGMAYFLHQIQNIRRWVFQLLLWVIHALGVRIIKSRLDSVPIVRSH